MSSRICRRRSRKKRVQWAKDLVTDIWSYDWDLPRSPKSPKLYEDRSSPPSRPFSPIVLGRPASPRITTATFPRMTSPMSPMQAIPIPVPMPLGLPIHGNLILFTETWDVRRHSSPPNLPSDLRDAPAVYGVYPATSFRLFFFPPIGAPFDVEIPMIATSASSAFIYTPVPTAPRWITVGEVLGYIHAALYRRTTLPYGLALSAAREARSYRSINRDEDVWFNTIRNVDFFPALTTLPGMQPWATLSLYFIGLESWMTSEGFQFVALFAPLPRPR